MPYSSTADLPEAVRKRYSGRCADVFRRVFNENFDRGESTAFAIAHTAAKNCQGSLSEVEPDLLTASDRSRLDLLLGLTTLAEGPKADHFYGAWKGGKAEAGGGAVSSPAKRDWPEPDGSVAGIEDAASAWSGTHFADLREFMRTGHVREGMSDKDDPIHGISDKRAAKSIATLTHVIARGGKESPELYRGMRPRAEVYQRLAGLKPGQTLDMSLSSWSASKDQAAKFAHGITGRGDKPVMLQLDAGGRGFRMGRYSLYPKEREWITNGRMVVKSVGPHPSGGLLVTLTQQSVFTTPASMEGAA